MKISRLLIEFLYSADCPNRYAALKVLEKTLKATGVDYELRHFLVADDDEAIRLRFLGSPSIRINGCDVEPNTAELSDFFLHSRIYSTLDGFRGYPSEDLILSALQSSDPALAP
ncbi:MAG TPA: hypothetical protein V6C82_05515 [Chroococcales cyanobacterium]|jgi:hypothetical protein